MDIKINEALYEYFFVKFKRLSVPNALMLKSTKGLVFAQSCEGCAAECIINLIEFLYFLKIFSKAE